MRIDRISTRVVRASALLFSIAASLAAACGGKVVDDTAFATVANDAGVTGDGGAAGAAVDIAVVGKVTYVTMRDGSVRVFGADPYFGVEPTPTTVPDVLGARAIAGGDSYACALVAAGLVCWTNGEAGPNATAQPGAAPPTAIALPSSKPVLQLATGLETMCAIAGTSSTDVEVDCWGYGRIDSTSGSYGPMNAPAVVEHPPVGNGWLGAPFMLFGNHGDTCLLDSAGTALCWGGTTAGELGAGDAGQTGGYAIAYGGKALSDIAFGQLASCAAAVDGTVWCAGNIGAGSTTTPVQVPGLASARHVAVSGTALAALALDSAGDVWAWDLVAFEGDSGLGLGSSPTPSLLTGMPKIQKIGAGYSHACALGVDGTVWCWGSNDVGETGQPVGTNTAVPTRVAL